MRQERNKNAIIFFIFQFVSFVIDSTIKRSKKFNFNFNDFNMAFKNYPIELKTFSRILLFKRVKDYYLLENVWTLATLVEFKITNFQFLNQILNF